MKNNGFTLLELSIALVIIGLLVGGVLAGRALIHSAKLNNIITEHKRFKDAFQMFEEKYNALPGDMYTATEIWGRADTGGGSGQCANPADDIGTGKQTCNGSGDRKIAEYPNQYEQFRVWQHLSNADFLEGQYTGIHSDHPYQTAVSVEIGVNIPSSKVDGQLGWNFRATTGSAYWSNHDQSSPGLMLGVPNYLGNIGSAYNEGMWISPQDTFNLDSKWDDGLPGKGQMRAPSFHANCVTSNDYTTATYALQNSGDLCEIYFTNALGDNQ